MQPTVKWTASVKSTASLSCKYRGKQQLVGWHTTWSRERLVEQNLVRSSLDPSSLPSSCSRKPEDPDPG